MSKVCISKCVNDARVPVRATYINLYKWPESDAEFVKTVAESNVHQGIGLDHHHHHHHHQHHHQPRVVDSHSCRQLYLRSYTFSKKETVPERTKKCFCRVRERVVGRQRRKRSKARARARAHGRKSSYVSRVKELSCAALCAIFQRLLSCTASVDVVDH